MNRNTKKGFTIVELIIVIAVIGILAAVLIPTFSGLIRKAMLASDEALVKNLNTALAADAENGTHATMTEALTAAKNFGFDVDKINAKVGGNEILWDSYNDCFVYIDEGEVTYIPDSKTKGNPADYQLWKIYDKAADIPATTAQKYSIYLADNNATALNSTLAVGFDAGQNTKLTEVTYVGAGSAKEVAINTNGGKLIVDAATDTVNHYGKADSVLIKAVDSTHCYNEYGSVDYIEVNKGKVVIQSRAVINYVEVKPAQDADNTNLIVDTTKQPSVTIVATEEAKDKVNTNGAPTTTELPGLDLSFLDNYSEDGTKAPEGFTYKDSKMVTSDIATKVEREVHISTKEALLYYGYKFNKEKAHAACKEHANNPSYCIWYQNTYINSNVDYLTIVYLECDIDFNNAILPKGLEIYGTTFNGGGHTIKNAKINGNTQNDGNVGLFFLGTGGGNYYSSLTNIKLDNIHVKTSTDYNANAHAGVAVSAGTTSISNVEITNSSAVGGKFTAAIAGFIDGGSITNCKVSNTVVSGQYKIGAAVGQIGAGNGDVTNNTFTAVTLKTENLVSDKNVYVVGKVVGYYNTSGKCDGNTFTGTLPEGVTNWIGTIGDEYTITGNNKD